MTMRAFAPRISRETSMDAMFAPPDASAAPADKPVAGVAKDAFQELDSAVEKAPADK